MEIKNFIIILFIATILSSCAPVIIGGVATGAMTAADRRSTGAITDDVTMELNINAKVHNYINNVTNRSDNNDISITSYNRNILLLGHVKNQEIATEIERIAKAQLASRNIYNYITIEGDRDFQGVASDSWITSKIRTMMLSPKKKGFYPNNVKIKTYAGVTYIMGILTLQEQKDVNDFVSTIPGVKKIITLYETQ